MEITVILPVHDYNDSIKDYLSIALDTIEKQEGEHELPDVLLVCAKRIEKDISGFIKNHKTKLNIIIILNNGKTDYQSQVNLGVESVKTNYFTILEFDDEFSTTFFKNAIKYIGAFDDVDLILPIIIEVSLDQKGVKMTNEVVWSRQFVGENGTLGYLNISALEQYSDFKINGGLIKKEEYDSIGGLKSNIKLAFTYEFLLRLVNNGSKIYTMPKIGYKHLVNRENSLFDHYEKTMSIAERKFWFNTAKKESNFIKDREIDLSLLDI